MALAELLAAAVVIMALALVICAEARLMATLQQDYQEGHFAALVAEDQAGTFSSSLSSCTAWDVKIDQGQASSVGQSLWEVQITNTCINSWCRISNVVVQCGQFHSASLVNPAVFRRLDPARGTCIVKNGKILGNGEMVAFRYRENFKEPLTLKSAHVVC